MTTSPAFSDRALVALIRFFKAEWSGALLAVLVLSLAFGIVSGGNFFAPGNLAQIVISGADIGLIAAGMTVVILTAGIDLSVGSILVLVTSVVGYVASYFGLDPVSAILVGLLVGLTVGMIQGGLIAYAGMPAFIVTLAGLSIWRGLANFTTKAQTSPTLDETFRYFGSYNPLNGFREPLPSFVNEEIKTWGFWQRLWEWLFGDRFAELSSGQVFEIFWLTGWNGLQAAFFIHIGFFIVISIMLSNMKLGRYVYAIGSNEQGARQAGINTKFYILLAYVICALCCAMGGIVRLGLSSTATPLLGSQYELLAIAAVVIGGTSLFGGRGSIWGTFLGVLLLKIINNGFIQSGLAGSSNEGTFVQMMLTGTIILIAVGMDIVRQSGSPLSIRRFLLGASGACVLIALLTVGWTFFASSVAITEHRANSALVVKAEQYNAALDQELSAARAKLDAAKAVWDPYDKQIKVARRPVNQLSRQLSRLPQDASLAERAELEAQLAEAQLTVSEIRREAADIEIAFQKSRLAFNILNAQKIRVDGKQKNRILSDEQLAERQADWRKNWALLFVLVLAMGLAVLTMARQTFVNNGLFVGATVVAGLLCIFHAYTILVPVLLLALALAVASLFIDLLADRARELANRQFEAA